MTTAKLAYVLLAWGTVISLLAAGTGLAQQGPEAPAAQSAAAAGDIADFFGQVGDQVYQHCIFELSDEQIEVQQALIDAYVRQGASSSQARQLAVKQIEPPTLSAECEQLKDPWKAALVLAPAAPRRPKIDREWSKTSLQTPAATEVLAGKKVLAHWDCASGVDYVTITHRGYERKLSGGEICSPFSDIVRPVPDALKSFRLGYTIATGRLFVIADDPQLSGRTIAWAISGREACRNNPDPDCLATRAIGPLPPGEYAFASDKGRRVSWGPRTRRMVAGIHMTKLWNTDRFSPAQVAAMRARGNIAIHVRLKGEMSEACLALEPKGWAYISQLIAEGRATGVNVYLDEPYPQLAESPPVVRASSFSLSSLFK